MKLAEALQERADLNKKIEQLRSRITSNALMQEGVLPVEDPEQLLKELDECLNQLEKLIIVINKTNMAISIELLRPFIGAIIKSDKLACIAPGIKCETIAIIAVIISNTV